MLNCVILKIRCKELYQKGDEKYDDIFSSDMSKIKKIANIFQKCFEVREEILAKDED